MSRILSPLAVTNSAPSFLDPRPFARSRRERVIAARHVSRPIDPGRRRPLSADDLCPSCGVPISAEGAHDRCPSCGWVDAVGT